MEMKVRVGGKDKEIRKFEIENNEVIRGWKVVWNDGGNCDR